MKFPSPSGDILTIHGDQRLVRKCYMPSVRPQLPILQTNHIERPPGYNIALSGDDLDPRVGWDARLKPIEETIPLSSLMDAPPNSTLDYNLNNATSLQPPSSTTQTSSLGQLLTYPR